jgi:hypothetical protein
MPKSTLPDWERVLSSAARLQQILPDAVLVGGTASALYAKHRLSADADHVLTDLRHCFDDVLADVMGDEKVVEALRRFDRLYPQPNGESSLQQLQIQLANPLPFDLDKVGLAEYKNLDARWHDWKTVTSKCVDCATLIFDHIVGVID